MEHDPTPAAAGENGGRLDVHSAVFCMAIASRLCGHRLNTATLSHRYGRLSRMTRFDLVGALKEIGIATRAVPVNRNTIRKVPLPAIVTLKSGGYAVLTAIDRKQGRLQEHGQANAECIDAATLRRKLSGWAIPVSPPAKAAGLEDGGAATFGLGWFLRTLFKYGGVMRDALVASAMVQLFALATPIVFMLVIDKVFAHHNLSTLDVLVFALAVVSLFDVLLGGVRTYLMSHTSNRVDVELGMRLFRHLMRVPLAYFESRTSGETIARIRELETVRHFLTGSTLALLVDLVFVVLFLVVMYLFSPVLAGIVLAALPLFFLVSAVMTPIMRGRLEDRHKLAAENQSFLVETLGSIETIKSAAVEPQQQQAWEERLAAYANCSVSGTSLSNWINQIIAFLSKALTVGLLYVGARMVIDGGLTVGQLIAFNMLSGRVIAPVQRLAQVWQELTSVRISMRRLGDIMQAPQEPALAETRTGFPALEGRIRFDRVSFRYDEKRSEVLEEVSFEVAPGELVGIMGATGSGKTTIVKLLQRLYAPSKGIVSIDGINVFAMEPGWLRAQIGVVPQDFVLFNRSIRDNIALFDPNINDEQVIRAARAAGAHEMIIELPDGYDTVLAERGRGLSAGQRQAIALARALVTDPAILVLDEATSAFDYETEQRFQQRFEAMRGNRTTLVIAHRLSALRDADRIVVLDHGRVIEDAPPAELAKSAGRFAALRSLHHADMSEPSTTAAVQGAS